MEKRWYTHQLPIYYKIGNQGNYRSIEDAGYKLFHRSDMLCILEKGIDQGIQDSIFFDYYRRLVTIEKSHKSYQNYPLEK